MEKKFRVVAESTIMDARIDVRYEDEAHEMFERFRNNGSYHKVYIMDNETGELYRTYDVFVADGGINVQEWEALDL